MLLSTRLFIGVDLAFGAILATAFEEAVRATDEWVRTFTTYVKPMPMPADLTLFREYKKPP